MQRLAVDGDEALVVRREVLREDAADVRHAPGEDEREEVPLPKRLLGGNAGQRVAGAVDLRDRRLEHCAVRLQPDVLRMRSDGEQRERDGQREGHEAEHEVHLAPSGEVRAQQELPHQVEHGAAHAGHRVGQADDQPEPLAEPAVQQAGHHQPKQRDFAEAYQHARKVPLPQLGVERHGRETQAGRTRRGRADDAHVETLQQPSDRSRQHDLGQIHDGHVQGHVEHVHP